MRNQSATGPRSAREIMLRSFARAAGLGGEPRRDQRAEGVAAHLEIGELVVGGAGRRQQHDRLGARGSPRVARGGGDRRLERAAALEGDRAFQRAGEIRRSPRRSDRPWRRAETAARSGSMPPSLALPPTIQKMSRKRQQRLFGRVGVGRLRIVDEQHAAEPADLLHAMGEAGKRRQAALQSPRRDARARAPRRRRRRRSGRCGRRAAPARRRDRRAAVRPRA